MLLNLPDFDLLAPNTIAEACSLLHHYAGDAKVVAGGTDLLVKMKHKRTMPRQLIDIKGIRDLNRISFHERDGLRIGALTTVQCIKDSPVVANKFPMLHQAASKMGTLHIRNLGTLGGNLANASPSAEFSPALLILGASVKCVGQSGERIVPIRDFFVGPGKSILQGDEILTEVHVTNPPSGAAGIYLKHSLRRMEVAIASAAVMVILDGDVCREARIALGAVAPTPIRAHRAEAVMKGQEIGGGASEALLLQEVARLASEESLPIDDIRSDARYRRRVVGMLVEQGLEEALEHARAFRQRRVVN